MRLLLCAVLSVALLGGCAHRRDPLQAVKVGAVALDTYIDRGTAKLGAKTDEAIARCNVESRTRAEYDACIAPVLGVLDQAEEALRQVVAAQAAAFAALESADDFERALEGVR